MEIEACTTVAEPETLYLPVPLQESSEKGMLILRDGTTAGFRIAETSDREALRAFFHRLSLDPSRLKLFPGSDCEDNFLDSLCSSEHPDRRLTLIALRTVEGETRVIAAGGYAARQPGTAEIAMAVEDEFRGKGLATLLLERLALLAAKHDFQQFKAVAHAENEAIIEVLRRSGLPIRERREDDFVEVDLSIVPSQASVEISQIRDRVFTNASLRPFFYPRAVAVVGASRKPSSLGFRILEALVFNRFQGPVYAVNQSASVVGSFPAYSSVATLPERVDLAVIAVPSQAVLEVVDDCARGGARGLVVITAGFAEVDSQGAELQRRLAEKVRGYGMRMVGPNCMGLLNSDPKVRLNASFSPVFPPVGRVAMSSQSGALGIAILSLARELQLGLSTFVSVGNKADVSGNDLIQFWEEDDNTDVILLYLESFGNPRRFARIARRVGRRKPIVVVKSGRTGAGKRAAGSHTAALTASDVAVEALFHQSGVIRAGTLQEMFELALTLSSQPLPEGNRVGILTNAGGPGILCADACEAGGLVVPELSQATRKALSRFLPAEASKTNPVDMIASAGPQEYRKAVEILLGAEEIDSLVIISVPLDTSLMEAIRGAVAEGIQAGRALFGRKKPVLACLIGMSVSPTPIRVKDESVPCYLFPESVARVLEKVSHYAAWRRRPPGRIPDFTEVQASRASRICRQSLQEQGEGWLSALDVEKVLTSFGLPVVPLQVARSADEAEEMARQVGFPVAVKLASRTIVHKTEWGGVFLNLADRESVRRAFSEIQQNLADAGKVESMEGVLIQPMVSGGVEVMAGVTEDPVFGPLVAFGLGGIHVEVLGDVQFRITPLSETDAAEMIQQIRGFRLLQGYRGHPPGDIDALQNLLLRLSRLVEEVPEIKEVDLNPVFALAPGQGCQIVDARILVRSL